MKIPIFTDDPHIQSSAAKGQLQPVSAPEWSFSRRQQKSLDKEVAEKFKDKKYFLDYLNKKNLSQETYCIMDRQLH